jgi:hypothetical protein
VLPQRICTPVCCAQQERAGGEEQRDEHEGEREPRHVEALARANALFRDISCSVKKRRREPEEDPDQLPSSDDDNKRRRIDSELDDSASRLFACPYAKYDPTRYSERNQTETNYRGCSSKPLRNIARVKQHLYRKHMQPEHYCPRCGGQFDRRDTLIAHSRETNLCEVRELPFKEVTSDQRNAVHERAPGKSACKVWYETYRILFPDSPVLIRRMPKRGQRQ